MYLCRFFLLGFGCFRCLSLVFLGWFFPVLFPVFAQRLVFLWLYYTLFLRDFGSFVGCLA